ncbi:probable RNA-binding protein ARP1 isoform X2 [Magnolia sinica]|uniref:probable RNA-binding protein ARP1 isoform X2 n=1 Tax=Magnolia sinica TaxID=86752 RepID=UPI002659D120|nr:probable RNA-binding protein ARP1 isoform X2 [Magnolia sinica]
MTMGNMGQFGDTTLTKVFVGGLAWETQEEAMREYFEKFGEILEAVIISDKITGRSKGYGFVTFKEPEAAKKACEDATPMINGRRANCNLASLGARRPRSASTTPPSGSIVGSRPATSSAPPSSVPSSVQWYYPTGTPPSPYHHHHHGVPYHAYGYSPAYVTDISYNPKLSYAGSYVNGQYSQMYPSQGMVSPNAVMPVYHPFYPFHQSQTMGVPAAHVFHPTTAGPITTVPALITKPAAMGPNTGLRVQLKVFEREA